MEAAGVKKKRKLTIAINGYKTKPIRPPKNRVMRELYIGGVSENVTVPSIIVSIFMIKVRMSCIFLYVYFHTKLIFNENWVFLNNIK